MLVLVAEPWAGAPGWNSRTYPFLGEATVLGSTNCEEVGVLITNAIALGRPIQGYAYGKEAEDVSGYDIMGEFGFKIENRLPAFRLIRDNQED